MTDKKIDQIKKEADMGCYVEKCDDCKTPKMGIYGNKKADKVTLQIANIVLEVNKRTIQKLELLTHDFNTQDILAEEVLQELFQIAADLLDEEDELYKNIKTQGDC